MRRTLRIALLPLVISNYDCSVSALSVKSPLHMSNGDNSISSSRQVPTTSVLDSSRTSSPLGTFFPCPCSALSLAVSRNETLWNDYFNRFLWRNEIPILVFKCISFNFITPMAFPQNLFYSDTETTTENQTTTIRRKGQSKAKAKGAPLVDSTLLRFLSAQKSQLQQTEEKENVSQTGIAIEKVVSDSDEILRINDVLNEKSNGGEETSDVGNDVPTAAVEDTTADVLSWFTQYNANRIAKRLKSLGASEECALEAGNAVQKYSLARTTRQRVRKFLRDRDLNWSSGSAVVEEPAYEVSNLRVEAETRGKIYDVDAVIKLLVEAGLTGRDIAAIFTHTPSITMMKAKRDGVERGGETLEDTVDRAFTQVLCSTIKLRKYDARKVLRSTPGLLTKRGSIAAKEVVSILSNLNVAPTSLQRDKAALPMLLSRSPASLFRFVAFLSSDYVRMPVSNIGPFLRRSECASVLDLVAPLPLYNSNLLEVGLSEEDIDTIPIQKLLKDGSKNMENEITKRYHGMFQTADFLRREVGIENLGKVISAFPQVLTVDRNKVVEIVNYLQEETGMYHADVAKAIEAYPMILETDISQIQKIIEYMHSIEVSDDVLGSIFRAFPALLSQDPDKSMKEVVQFLEEIGVTNIGRFIT
jgi:hypothetical protein